jgi:hypothetical protein
MQRNRSTHQVKPFYLSSETVISIKPFYLSNSTSVPLHQGYFSAMMKLGEKASGSGVFYIDANTVDPYRWLGPPLEGGFGGLAGRTHNLKLDACGGVRATAHPADATRRAEQSKKEKLSTEMEKKMEIGNKSPRRGPGPEPKLTVVFVTKRPGGYDVLLNSLKAQTSRDYELVCVDELAHKR